MNKKQFDFALKYGGPDIEATRCKCGKLRAAHDAVSRNGKVVLIAEGCEGFRPEQGRGFLLGWRR